MKQNEKILVYAVTGFLAVILGVAVLFGKDSTRRLPDVRTDVGEAPSLESLLDRNSAVQPKAEPVAGQPTTDGAAQPLVANVQLAPPTPAAIVTERLGLSRQEHGFRVVRAARGDTLGDLVRKWCGSLDPLADAQGLNETLQTLRVGQDVVLPWVEDEVILAAFDKRIAASEPQLAIAPVTSPGLSGVGIADASASKGFVATDGTPTSTSPSAGSAPVAAPEANATKTYKIVAKDSLWKIAEREVGKGKAYAYVEKILEANPNLDAERLRAGQTITLPAKN